MERQRQQGQEHTNARTGKKILRYKRRIHQGSNVAFVCRVAKTRSRSVNRECDVETKDNDILESNPSALLLASAEIRKCYRKYSEQWNEESEESDDDYVLVCFSTF